jgi:Family of unknown function (DUF6502)
VQEIVEALKGALVDAAIGQAEREGLGVNVSRLAAMTGLHRRDVMRLQDSESQKSGSVAPLITRLIGVWNHQRPYCAARGSPKILQEAGDGASYHSLVTAVSRDLHPGTLLTELIRIGAVERTAEGLRLLTAVHRIDPSSEEALRHLAVDTGDLFAAVEGNFSNDEGNLHARTEFDAVPASRANEARSWIRREGSLFHKKVREYLASIDMDSTEVPQPRPEEGVRISVGAYAVVEGSQSEKTEKGDR